MSNPLTSQLLTEKLSKLNHSQQCIESLSRWCISHRKKARQVVESWEKLFNNSPKEKQVPFMYLANDILQNSRRKGSEFVNEFWKILPRNLKSVCDGADNHTKTVAMRLVDIWDERKVFGSHGRVLKDEMLGKEPSTKLDNEDRSVQSMRILKKDANALRIRLAIGCLPEKIMSAFQSIHDVRLEEDTVMNNCNTTASHMLKIEKDIDIAHVQVQGFPPSTDELHEHKTALQECAEQLVKFEANREALVSHLKEALQEQESKLDLIRAQLHVAKVKVGRTSNPTRSTISSTVILSTQPDALLSAEEQQKKKTAAEVAAKLSSLPSSAEVLSSVFSSLVAQQAASKRPRIEKPMQSSDTGNGSGYIGQQVPQQHFPVTQPPQPPFPPPPLMPASPAPPVQQYIQTTGGMQFMPYGYNGGNTSGSTPPPPLPSLSSYNVMGGFSRPNPLQHHLPSPPPPPPPTALAPAQLQTQEQQQPGVSSGFYPPPPGIGFYGQQSTKAVAPQ